MNNQNNPAFLISMPRSGSTLLSLMLGSHPQVCCPPEPWIILAISEYFNLADVKSIAYGREWAEIASIEFLLSLERKKRGALGKLFNSIRKKSTENDLLFARFLLNEIYNSHLEVTNKEIFIDKTPRNYVLLELIKQVLPSSKKIVLVRNPFDIFASYKSTWEISRGIFTAKGVSVHTRDFCEGLFSIASVASSNNSDTTLVRYEDLVANPDAVMHKLSQFLEINFSESMLTYYENTALIEEYKKSPVGDPVLSNKPLPVNSLSVSSWEQRLELEDIKALIDVLGVQIFEQLGYKDVPEKLKSLNVNFPSETKARVRRELLMKSLKDNVIEKPFSSWDSFVSPLIETQKDRDDRLSVILSQQSELESQQNELESQQKKLSELRLKMENQLLDIQSQNEALRVCQKEIKNLNRLKTLKGFIRFKFNTFRSSVLKVLGI